MKRYSSPKLDVYGRARELTLGGSGSAPDLIISTGPPLVISVDPTNPTCTLPVVGNFACITTVP